MRSQRGGLRSRRGGSRPGGSRPGGSRRGGSRPGGCDPGVGSGRPSGRTGDRTGGRWAAAATLAAALLLAAGAAAGAFASSSRATAAQSSRSGSAGHAAGPARTAAGLGGSASSGQATARSHQAPLRTSCRSVAHIGDSTSADLISPADLPDPGQRLRARYRDVGVARLWLSASGGRSIVEVLPGQVNGYNVARGWRSEGFRGCWVFALGTNDTANVAVGSDVGLMARIRRMMSVAHGQPVLWVNTRSLLTAGPWSESNQRAWDHALVRALRMYPNMKIFNWAAVVRPGWFLPDGIHYTPAGCAYRALSIARALAKAFPLHGHDGSRIIR